MDLELFGKICLIQLKVVDLTVLLTAGFKLVCIPYTRGGQNNVTLLLISRYRLMLKNLFLHLVSVEDNFLPHDEKICTIEVSLVNYVFKKKKI